MTDKLHEVLCTFTAFEFAGLYPLHSNAVWYTQIEL